MNNVPADGDGKLYTTFQNITGILTKVHMFLKPKLTLHAFVIVVCIDTRLKRQDASLIRTGN